MSHLDQRLRLPKHHDEDSEGEIAVAVWELSEGLLNA